LASLSNDKLAPGLNGYTCPVRKFKKHYGQVILSFLPGRGSIHKGLKEKLVGDQGSKQL
jgi:hypothetical protein